MSYEGFRIDIELDLRLIRTHFLEIPRFLAPKEIEAGLLLTFLRKLKVLAIVKVSANSVRTRGFL